MVGTASIGGGLKTEGSAESVEETPYTLAWAGSL